MPASTQSVQPRLIVIPRQLEGFFYERLDAAVRRARRPQGRGRPPRRRAPAPPLGLRRRTVQRAPPRDVASDAVVVAAGAAVLLFLRERTMRGGARSSRSRD